MKLESTQDLNHDKTLGFVKIEEKGKAQQTTVSTKTLAKAVKFLADLENLGFETVTLTVENDQPLVIGGKVLGIGIAPRIDP